MIKYVLWDIDGTLLNFSLAEAKAIRACFEEFGFGDLTDDRLDEYKKINMKYWKALERGEISRQEVLEGRFREFFEKYSYDTRRVAAFNIRYQENLGKTYVFNKNAYEAVRYLSKNYIQFAATNGLAVAQNGKLEGAGLDKIFKESFISELIGYEKPSYEFFSYVFDRVGSAKKDEYIIIGDSLTSDIAGGLRVGIKTIWFNPEKIDKPDDITVDYEINDLIEVKNIL